MKQDNDLVSKQCLPFSFIANSSVKEIQTIYPENCNETIKFEIITVE